MNLERGILKKSYGDNLDQWESWLQEAAGMDDESLLREMEEAQREWELEKALHPEEVQRVKQEARLRANLIMAQAEAADRKKHCKKRQSIGTKQFVQAAVLTVVIGGVLVGGISSIAKSEYQYQKFPGQKKGGVLLRNNVTAKFIDDRLDEAYKLTYQKLDIPVLVLDYVPNGMRFEEVEVKREHILLKFSYKGKYIYLKEDRDKSENIISTLNSDRNSNSKIYNEWIEKDVYLEENKLDSGDIEYSVSIEGDKAFYYLSGIMEEEEFIEIVENLRYQ